MSREPNQDVAVRRIAILLRALPTHTHSVLLDRLGAGTKQRVDEELTNGAEVDPVEQYRVLIQLRDEFLIQNEELSEIESEIQDEISIGRSRIRTARSKRFESIVPQELQSDQPSIDEQVPVNANVSLEDQSVETNASGMDDPFAFVADCQSEQLAEILVEEHSQTIAVVLASIAPTQAAEILTSLPMDIQRETLSRIGQLEKVAPETIAEIASQIRTRVTAENQSFDGSGRATLRAIMDALPEGSLGQDSPLAKSLPRWARSLSETTDSENHDDEIRDGDASTRLRVFHGMDAEPTTDDVADFSGSRAPKTDGQDDASFPSIPTDVQRIDESIRLLSTETLCKALGLVSSRTALLTLCGLPKETSERAIGRLPRKLSKKVRAGMRSLGELQLSEIDDAKREVYEVVLRMNDQHRSAA